MDFYTVSSVDEPGQYDCLVLPVFRIRLGSGAERINPLLASELKTRLAKSTLFNQKAGCEMFYSVMPDRPLDVVMVQFDQNETITIKTIQKQINKVINSVSQSHNKSILLCFAEVRPRGFSRHQFYQLLTQYIEMTQYRLSKHANQNAQQNASQRMTFCDPAFKRMPDRHQSIKSGQAIARGINLAKSISNLPANICTPSYIANQALELSKKSSLQTTVLDEARMKKLNMNCILAVSKGSCQPANLVVMKYRGREDDSSPVILIGKGVTFDSGGYSIKSASGMHEMKYDMCGAACVMGTLQVISLLKLPVNAVALLPCTENLINGRAFKPGDVIKSMSGKTVEILSTDAEGRLLLADVLSYAQQFKPALVIDIATLTGAAITALGYDISAVMSNSDLLSKQLCRAGQMSHDYLWPLPVWEDYADALKSNFADFASSAGRAGNTGAGAIVAASFLSGFIKKYRWAHIDVAGTAWNRGKHLSASGRPVALLSQFLINYSHKPF